MSSSPFRLAPALASVLDGAPVRVGTENHAKLGAVESALRSLSPAPSPSLLIVPVGVSSGVAEQPVGFAEIIRGASNRARAALASGEAVLAVGIEDGLARFSDSPSPSPPSSAPSEADSVAGFGPDSYFNVGCAWVTDGTREGRGFSSGFAYPPGCLDEAVRDQAPIGNLFDALWQAHRDPAEAADSAPSGRSGGNIGRLTEGCLDRSAYGAQAVLCALVRFLHVDLYD